MMKQEETRSEDREQQYICVCERHQHSKNGQQKMSKPTHSKKEEQPTKRMLMQPIRSKNPRQIEHAEKLRNPQY
jgi:hypothetical protein